MEKVEVDKSLENEILLGPYKYLLQVPGKNFRVTIIDAFNHWLQIPQDKLTLIYEIIQMLHEASLLLDDIEDASELRRGVRAAHHVFGTPQTINCANYVCFLALQKSLLLDHPSAPCVFAEQMVELHKGQGSEIHWRDQHQCPSEQEYLLMATRSALMAHGVVLELEQYVVWSSKWHHQIFLSLTWIGTTETGGLFLMAIRFMQLFSKNQSHLGDLCKDLGLLFQIRDDYANLKSSELTKTKGFADDLSEGKFSFPIVHAINSQAENNLVSNILKQKPQEYHAKAHCISLLEDCGSFKYTRHFVCRLVTKINKQISDLGGNDQLTDIVNKMIEIFTCDN